MTTTAQAFAAGLLIGGAGFGSGCDRLSSFDTGPGEAFCGVITLAGGYRTGFSPRAQLRLTFDSSKVEQGQSPGKLSSYDAEREQAPRLLQDADLRPFEAMSHDALSELELGDGRDRNLIYAVSPADTAAESLLAVVSLRNDDRVEVRLIRPGQPAAASFEHEPLFGLFVLDRREGDCGF